MVFNNMRLHASSPLVRIALILLILIWIWVVWFSDAGPAAADESTLNNQGSQMSTPYPTSDTRPRVHLQTSHGDIEIELFDDKAPTTTEHILKYVDDGFYDGLIFHRVIAGFVLQAGGFDIDMKERQTRGSIRNESDNGLENLAGTLAMARRADPDSADSQFYINVADNGHLNARPGEPGYTVFGQVVAGQDVVTRIELTETGIRQGMPGVPVEAIVIKQARRVD